MSDATYRFGKFSLDVAEHRLLRDGETISLTPRVFAVLRVLVESSGHLVEKDRLLREVWNDAFVEEGNLNRAVSVLRKTLGESPAQRYIETVPKRGYRFIAPVLTESGSAEPLPVTGSHRRLPVARHFRAVGVLVLAALLVVAAALSYVEWARRQPNARTIAAPVHRQITFAGKEGVPALSPNGKQVAYVSGDSGARKVLVQDVDGGPSLTVFDAPEVSALRWSPDGTDLLFWARGKGLDGLYLASASGGARKIGPAGAFVTCWSPDGAIIAIAEFVPQKIRFVNRLGEHQRSIALAASNDWIWDLDWSHVDNRILFVAMDRGGRPSVWSIQADGTGQTKLLSATGEIFAARWAPAGNAFYYFNRSNQTVSVFRVAVSRKGVPGEPIPIISGLEADGAFSISADASRLVYARAPYYSNLWLVEAGEGTTHPVRTTQLTHGTSVVERPRVSPDGQYIAFSMGQEWRTNVYTMSAAGGSPRQLTFFNALSVAPTWAPSGRAVAFASNEGGTPRLWIVNADGTDPRALAATDISPNYLLSWAPGNQLLYQKGDYRNFYRLDPVTARRELLLNGEPGGFVSSADYSPDGQQLAVTWTGRPDQGIWVLDEKGRGERLIQPLPNQSEFNPFAIGWSPDGAAIIAYAGRRATSRGSSVPFGETITAGRVLRIPATGAAPMPIVDLPFAEVGTVAMFPDARRFVVSVYTSRSDVWIVDNFDVSASQAARVSGPSRVR